MHENWENFGQGGKSEVSVSVCSSAGILLSRLRCHLKSQPGTKDGCGGRRTCLCGVMQESDPF